MLTKERLLIVLPKRLGDSIFCTPALAFIKKHRPDVMIDAIVLTQITYEVMSGNPAVRQCYFANKITDYVAFASSYDYLLELHYHHKSIQDIIERLPLKKLSSGKEVEGVPAADHALFYIASLLNIQVEKADQVYHLYPTAEDNENVDALLLQNGIKPHQTLVILHAGCHSASKSWWKCCFSKTDHKTWPVSRFIELARLIMQRYPNVAFVLTGSQAETLLAKKVVRRIPCAVDFTDKTTVMQLAALVKKATVVVVRDTGMLHVACAMHAPLVGLYGPIDVRRTGPYPNGSSQCVVSKSSFGDITAKEVFAAVNEVWNRRD